MNIVVLGASSTIAKEICRTLLRGAAHDFVLVGRNGEKLRSIKLDLTLRGAGQVREIVFDLDRITEFETLLREVSAAASPIDLLLVAHGTLPAQREVEESAPEVAAALLGNFVSHAALLAAFAPVFVRQKSGTVAVISSVAGDRGRRSNYVYGSAKAGLQAYVEGFAAKLADHGVHVLDVRPGMVRTAMTAHLDQGILFSSPEKVAADVVKAITAKSSVSYTPAVWRYLMLVIRLIPRAVMRRLRF